MAPRPDLVWEEQWPGMRGQNWGQGDSTAPKQVPSNICNICTSAQKPGQVDQARCCCLIGGLGQKCDSPGVGAPDFQGWLHPNRLCDLGPICPLHLSHLHKEGFGPLRPIPPVRA